MFQIIHCLFLILNYFQFFCHNPDPTCVFLTFHIFHYFSPYSRSYIVCFSFSMIFSVLAILQFLQCVFLIFQLFHCFSPYSRSYSVFLSFCTFFFSVSCPIFCPTMWFPHFPGFFSFLAINHVIQCLYSFFTFFSFLDIIQVLQCVFPFFTFFTAFCHIPGPTLCVSNFPWFAVFSPYSRSYCVNFSFSTFLSVAIHIPGETVCVSHFRKFSAS